MILAVVELREKEFFDWLVWKSLKLLSRALEQTWARGLKARAKFLARIFFGIRGFDFELKLDSSLWISKPKFDRAW